MRGGAIRIWGKFKLGGGGHFILLGSTEKRVQFWGGVARGEKKIE